MTDLKKDIFILRQAENFLKSLGKIRGTMENVLTLEARERVVEENLNSISEREESALNSLKTATLKLDNKKQNIIEEITKINKEIADEKNKTIKKLDDTIQLKEQRSLELDSKIEKSIYKMQNLEIEEKKLGIKVDNLKKIIAGTESLVT